MEGEKQSGSHTIYIVSGGAGASGEQLVQTVLAQFGDSRAQVIVVPNIRLKDQLDDLVQRAKKENATLVYTLVDGTLRRYFANKALQAGITAIDLMGPMLDHLTLALDQLPLEQPGLYRRLHKPYFDRVAAIEYIMAHDDGQRPDEWRQAEILLLGVSRVVVSHVE